MPLLWGFPRSIPRYCGPLPRAMLCSCALLFCSSNAQAELFLGVAPGDSCASTYQMEVARGAEPSQSQNIMSDHGFWSFEMRNEKRAETSIYICDGDRVRTIIQGVWFETEAQQQQYLIHLQQEMKKRFGEPVLDTFNLGWLERFFIWLNDKPNPAESLAVVHWQLPQGATANIGYAEIEMGSLEYGVTIGWATPPHE